MCVEVRVRFLNRIPKGCCASTNALSFFREMHTGTDRIIRVLLIDGNPSFRTRIARLLETESDLQVVGTAATALEGIAQATLLHPDVAVVNLRLPDSLGLAVVTRLRTADSKLGLIAHSLFDGESYWRESFHAGADLFLSDSELDRKLVSALRQLTMRGSGAQTGGETG